MIASVKFLLPIVTAGLPWPGWPDGKLTTAEGSGGSLSLVFGSLGAQTEGPVLPPSCRFVVSQEARKPGIVATWSDPYVICDTLECDHKSHKTSSPVFCLSWIGG